MTIPGAKASSSGDRRKKYYSHATGGVNHAVRDSNEAWKWISVFSTDTLDLATVLPAALDLTIEPGQKFVVKSEFRQLGSVTVRQGAVLQISGVDYVLGHDSPTADRSPILSIEPGGSLVIEGGVLHVRYGAALHMPEGVTVTFLSNGAISYEGGPESSTLGGEYVDGEAHGPLSDGTRIKAPVLKKFYRQTVDLATYSFTESSTEYYNDGDIVTDSRGYRYFEKNQQTSSGDYVENESDLWHVLNYFYDRSLLTVPLITELNKESDDDSVSLAETDIKAYYEAPVPRTVIRNVTDSTAIPREVVAWGMVFSGDQIRSGDEFSLPAGVTCQGDDPILVRFDHRYTLSFRYHSTAFGEAAWKGDTIPEPTVENVFTVNGEPFTVNGEDYDLRSGKVFIGWFERGSEDEYDFSSPLTRDVELIGMERPE